ncbi:trehalose-phosphatase [Actinomadura craniellae]|uniref:Trehalose 6-phosphate phosphatase n=1 Tax=Actinomadura craniellae TaxID=2231787 RepID=A0A365GZQ1_9ACTN|nr:trehalose-phosphatase [Actinomadura craniellae]RAY11423.1 trehalose-phosphatase [Actinomadura craniellae]
MTPAGAEGLAAIRKSPGEAVLAFDFDGTLSPIVEDPAAARAHPDAAAALARLSPLVGTLAIITGRPAAHPVGNGGLGAVDGLVVLGQYGLERWEAGRLTVPEPPPGVAEVRAKLPRVLAAAGAPAGVHIEDKGHALAVHTRRTAEPEVALERLRSLLGALAERHGLTVEPGRFVLELRPPGMDKGVALRGLLDPAAPPSAVLFGGDDLGDLAAFAAVEELRAEGVPGVKLCSGSAEVTAVAERADLIVDGPAGVVRFLRDLADSLG